MPPITRWQAATNALRDATLGVATLTLANEAHSLLDMPKPWLLELVSEWLDSASHQALLATSRGLCELVLGVTEGNVAVAIKVHEQHSCSFILHVWCQRS
jgi:hypothetical protein